MNDDESKGLIYWWGFTHFWWFVIFSLSLPYDSKIGLILSLIPGFASLFIAWKMWGVKDE